MLLFYEDEPDATLSQSQKTTHTQAVPSTRDIDPLAAFGSHSFISYPGAAVPRSRAPADKEDDLTIHNASSWTYCGPILAAKPHALPPSLHTWAAATMNMPSTFLDRLLPFLSFLNLFLSETGAQHYWLTVRATKSTHDYDTPRWHTDENFFSADPDARGLGFGPCNGSRRWKLATTLLGPRTLFLKNNAHALRVLGRTKARERAGMANHVCTSIRCLGCSTYADTVRHALAHSLAAEEVESPAGDQVALFRIGGEEGAVHSEPRCPGDRVFVNVVPGTREDLEALMSRFGMGFPRAWCFGNPVGFVQSDEKEHLESELL